MLTDDERQELVSRVRKRLCEHEESTARRQVFRMLTGLRTWTGRTSCLRLLANPRHRCRNCGPEHDPQSYPEALPGWELWRTPEGGFAFTAHPERLAHELWELADRYGCELATDGPPSLWSWGRPGTTILAVLIGKPRR